MAISRAAGPDGARNNSGATSIKLNREFRLHRRCEGRKRAWLWRPWAAAEPGRAPSQRTESTHRATHQRPGATVWRALEGPEGTGGLRDRPLRAAGSRVAISRAAGPDGARNTSGATSNNTQRGRRAGGPPPTGAPSSPAQQGTQSSPAPQGTAQPAISGSRAPSGSPTRKQHLPGQASAPNRRRQARDPRPRR